jgi:hypothetical protein
MRPGATPALLLRAIARSSLLQEGRCVRIAEQDGAEWLVAAGESFKQIDETAWSAHGES